MLLPINFRETAIALQSNPNIRACVLIVAEELHNYFPTPLVIPKNVHKKQEMAG